MNPQQERGETMLPSEVNGVKVKDGTEFDKLNNAVRYQEYTFYIGDHGPFTEKFYIGEQDARLTQAIPAAFSAGLSQPSTQHWCGCTTR